MKSLQTCDKAFDVFNFKVKKILMWMFEDVAFIEGFYTMPDFGRTSTH